MKQTNQWAMILAGGDGTRLEKFTELLHGDKRPKQFSVLVGNQTLLSLTLHRTARVIPPERTVVMLTRNHEEYYKDEFHDFPNVRRLVQPRNRGTAPAIYWGIVEAANSDPNAIVAILPSDHFYSRESRFLESLEVAFDEAEKFGKVVLLGAPATGPETSYGWIELGASGNPSASSWPVNAMWEKPERAEAEKLFHRGCLWSTFVMVGQVRSLLHLIRKSTPEISRLLYRSLSAENRIESAYDQLRPIDFSREVLLRSQRDLLAVPMGDAGWSDLGEAPRAVAVLAEHGTNTQRSLAAALAARG